MRPLWGRSLPFLMPDPGGVTCLLPIFGPGSTISTKYHYAPGGTISPKYHYAPGGNHSLNMRPLWGRFLPFLHVYNIMPLAAQFPHYTIMPLAVTNL